MSLDLLSLFKEVHNTGIIGDQTFPLPSFLTEEADNKLLVVIGDNATGKSFITATLLAAGNGWHNINGYNVSMGRRTSDGMEKLFVYGDETQESTGATTLKSIIGAFNNIKSYAEDKETSSKMLLILDEPTLGLSLGYEKAMGKFIAQQFNEMKDIENVVGVVVVTHSKSMVKQIQACGLNPSVVSTESAKTLKDWYDEDEDKSIEDLLSLKQKGLDGLRAINKYIKDFND